MKKLGFTLTELIVALTIVGVVSSLVIPSFVSESKNKANAKKLSAIVSTVERAFSTMISTEAVNNLSETAFGKSPSAGNLGIYLKLSGNEDSLSDFYSSATPFKTLSGATWTPTVDDIYQTKNGALLIYTNNRAIDTDATDEFIRTNGGSAYGLIGYFTIDVNGKTLPNIVGRDVFHFLIGDDGCLYPAGGRNFAILAEGSTNTWNTAGGTHTCIDGGTKNAGCTARLIENNYEVDY